MSVATLTGKQAKKILELLEDTPSEQVQRMLSSGLFTDLRDANFDAVTPKVRNQIQQLLGLDPHVTARRAAQRKQRLLQFLGTVTLPAMSGLGKVKDVFRVGTVAADELFIETVAPNFLERFGEVEIPAFAGSELHCYELRRPLNTWKSQLALGEEDNACVTLGEIVAAMKLHNVGQNLPLPLSLVHTNSFFVFDGKVPCEVSLGFCVTGWCVRAPEGDIGMWPRGRRVFSHVRPESIAA